MPLSGRGGARSTLDRKLGPITDQRSIAGAAPTDFEFTKKRLTRGKIDPRCC